MAMKYLWDYLQDIVTMVATVCAVAFNEYGMPGM